MHLLAYWCQLASNSSCGPEMQQQYMTSVDSMHCLLRLKGKPDHELSVSDMSILYCIKIVCRARSKSQLNRCRRVLPQES